MAEASSSKSKRIIMKKAVSKRIKVSKTGKLLRRPMAVDHFRSKKTGNQTRAKRNYKSIAQGYQKQFHKYLTTK